MKPDGTPYLNTFEDWLWLCKKAAKPARWHGYVPFERIVDENNDAAQIFRSDETPGEGRASVSAHVERETDGTFNASVVVAAPAPLLTDFGRRQPFALVIFAEKSSCE